jgi:hypothetical protein
MKRIILYITGIVLLTSCASTKMEKSAQKGQKDMEKYAQQSSIKQAVGTRRFLIRFDKLYANRGGNIELIPKSNYILLDGERCIISAAYFGRQFTTRPVRGIDMVGKTVKFEMKDNTSKGTYEIRMKVANDMNIFNVNLIISKDGYCNAYIYNNMIDNVRYTGNILPLKSKPEPQEQENTEVPSEMLI